jgi:hypothetical protein
MKTAMPRLAALAALALVLGAGRAAADEPPTALLDPYFRIQSQLADDKTDGVKADADLVATEAAKLGPAGDPIAAAAHTLGAADSLSAARDAFGTLSDALIAYADATRTTLGKQSVTVYCPMVKKSWVQRGDKVRNPYFGKGMLGCGEVKKRG